MDEPRSFAADAPDYLEAIRQFALHRVDFVVCGGVACVLQGTQRTTEDVDLCLRLDRANLERVIVAAEALDMQPRIPEPIEQLLNDERRQFWIATKQAMVYTLVPRRGGIQIDVFLHYPIPFDRLKERANARSIGDVRILISCKEDLVEAKRAVSPPRKTDLRDIEDLLELIRREQHDPPA